MRKSLKIGYYHTKTAYPHGQAANKHNIIKKHYEKTSMIENISADPLGQVCKGYALPTGYFLPTT